MSREAMKLALEALENWLEFDPENFGEVDKKAITALQKALANEALDKKAENARELGLDYKPAQHKPVAWTLLLVGEHNGLVGKAGEKFIGHPEHYERVDVYTSPPSQQEPVAFLANGTRFKMAFFESDEDGAGNTGTYVTCFNSFEKELDGRWVALVSAEDDCHLKLTPPAQRTWVGLTDDEVENLCISLGAKPIEVRFVEAKLKEKNNG